MFCTLKLQMFCEYCRFCANITQRVMSEKKQKTEKEQFVFLGKNLWPLSQGVQFLLLLIEVA